jgi:hypothetical protein
MTCVAEKPEQLVPPPPPPMLTVAETGEPKVVPPSALAFAVKVVVLLTVIGPIVCVVALDPLVQAQAFAVPPAVQLMVSVTCVPADTLPVGAPAMLHDEGTWGGVFDHVTAC